MVVDGSDVFRCQHEFVALPYGFVCHKCEHARFELPLPPKKGTQRLYFFPVSATWVSAAIENHSYATGTLS